MKYFLDTEFLEGPQTEILWGLRTGRMTKPTIDLISIGIVAEDGREYYAVSSDFNVREAWDRFQLDANGDRVYWIRNNVLRPIFEELSIKALGEEYFTKHHLMTVGGAFNYNNMKDLIEFYGKTREWLADDIKDFCGPISIEDRVFTDPEFYGYYSDYDWVVFCWIFGLMIDLPEGFPMYCIDLKQEFDRQVRLMSNSRFGQLHCSIMESKYGNRNLFYPKDIYTFNERIDIMKSLDEYPRIDKSKSHNALYDAQWTYEFYKFLHKG